MSMGWIDFFQSEAMWVLFSLFNGYFLAWVEAVKGEKQEGGITFSE